MKYTCYVFSEGGSDKKLLLKLIPLLERYHARNWRFDYGNASGSSPEIILNQCKQSIAGKAFDLVLCFVDRDVVRSFHSGKWKKEVKRLEMLYPEVLIVWQIESLEDEIRRGLGYSVGGKSKLISFAKRNVEKLVNSTYWNKIKQIIIDKENSLNL